MPDQSSSGEAGDEARRASKGGRFEEGVLPFSHARWTRDVLRHLMIGQPSAWKNGEKEVRSDSWRLCCLSDDVGTVEV